MSMRFSSVQVIADVFQNIYKTSIIFNLEKRCHLSTRSLSKMLSPFCSPINTKAAQYLGFIMILSSNILSLTLLAIKIIFHEKL